MHAGCLRGFPGELPNDTWTDLPTGEVIFADLRFHCSGMLRGVRMLLLFEADIAYNASLKSDLTLWQVNGSHYQRSDGATHTLDVSLASLLPGEHINDGRITIEQRISVHFNASVDLPVRPGHVLGLSFPPSSSIDRGIFLSTVTVLNHIPLAGEQDVHSTLIQLIAGDCFSPEQGTFPCPQVVQSSIRPAVQVQVDFDSDVNTQAVPASQFH